MGTAARNSLKGGTMIHEDAIWGASGHLDLRDVLPPSASLRLPSNEGKAGSCPRGRIPLKMQHTRGGSARAGLDALLYLHLVVLAVGSTRCVAAGRAVPTGGAGRHEYRGDADHWDPEPRDRLLHQDRKSLGTKCRPRPTTALIL